MRRWKEVVLVATGVTVVYLLFRNVRACEEMARHMREALE